MENMESPIVLVDGEPTDIKPPAVWLHNWMYSVVPGPTFEIYLAGFCKNCHGAFTYKLPISPFNEIRLIENVPVPKYGCVGLS